MLYDLRLLLGTRYRRPAGPGRHLARVTPRDEPGAQRVLRAGLAIQPPPAWRGEGADFWGNPVVAWASPAAQRDVEVVMTARVERLAPPPPRDGLALAALAAALGASRDLGPLSPLHFAAPSPLVPPAPAVAAWARDLGPFGDAREAALALSAALHRRMTFDGKATDVNTPAVEAFEAGRGVCQDYAHVLIGALRSLGIPAGYVSGLIRTTPPPGRPRLAGADAMHAWVMAWCGHWIELDPTNDREAGLDHVVVARGRDYADVAPIRGVLRMAGAQVGRHGVDMVPVAQAAANESARPFMQ